MEPPTWEQLTNLRLQEQELMLKYWLQSNLFTFQWWLIVLVPLLLWIVWWRQVDRRRFREITYYGLTITLIVFFLDTLGTNFSLWQYPVTFIPLVPTLLGADLAVLPVLYMHAYQHSPTLRIFWMRLIALGAFASFIAGPLAEWLSIYEMRYWSHLLSFPSYIAVGLLARWVIVKAIAIEQRSASK
jgi:hypothetical protein